MKIKLIFSSVLILTLCAFVFNYPFEENTTEINSTLSLPPFNGWLEKFHIGAMDMVYEDEHQNFNDMGLSLWHRYIGTVENVTLKRHVPSGWFVGDSLLANTSDYAGTITNKIAEIYNNSPSVNRRKILLTRPKITWLCYGQSSTYECEPLNSTNNGLWFYSYNNHETGTEVTDNGKQVVYCQSTPSDEDQPGYVVKRLKTNTEQCQNYFNTSAWEGDIESHWIVKPRIRIPTSIPTTIPETPVCRIEVLKTDSVTYKVFDTIKAKHFLNAQGQYNGQYIEEFIDSLKPKFLQFDSSLSNESLAFSSRGTKAYDDSNYNFRSDIRVYWLGNCDMWIDYVKVENDVADSLFKGKFDHWIEDEVNMIADYTINNERPAFKFYLEYAAFNNIPCMKYVNQKLKDYSDNQSDPVDLMQDMVNRISEHVNWNDKMLIFDADFLSEHYINEVGFRQFFTETYPFFSFYYPGGQGIQYYSKIPNTLPTHYGTKVLAEAVSPTEYDTWLQHLLDTLNWMEGGPYNSYEGPDCYYGNTTYDSKETAFDEGNFRLHLKLGNEISKITGVPFILMPQLHQWYLPGEVRREPTHEELDLLTNLAVSYGVKGIQYFWYHTYLGNQCDYGIGMVNDDGNKRTNNVYDQGVANNLLNKWEIISNVSDRLTNRWGPTILSFDNEYTNSYIYRLESQELINNSYFTDVITYVPGTGLPACINDNPGGDSPSGYVYECQEDRYVQVATFQNGELNTKYFMVANRRCAPINNESQPDGSRIIKIKFDNNSPSFSGTVNWQIIEVGNPSASRITFNKNNPGLINLGNFNPAEGKLYKVVPVINSREGGVLIADETVEGSVTVGGPIDNNGVNITIEPSSTINFIDSGKIAMNGGEFICGEVRTDHGTDVIMTSANRWNGITFNSCSLVSINSTKFEKVDSATGDQNFALKFIDCDTIKIRYCNFITESGMKNGAISINYLPIETPIYPLIDLLGNTFNCNGISNPSVQIMNYGDIQNPVLIRWNNLEGNNSPVGMLLNNVTAGVIRNNTFVDYTLSINALATYCDIYGNNINEGNTNNGHGVELASGSNINMNTALLGYYIGGLNSFVNMGTNSSNVYLDNATVDVNYGGNFFKVKGSSYHFDGIMSMDYYTDPVPAEQNCFYIDNDEDDLVNNVIWYDDNYGTVNFSFKPINCSEIYPQDYELISYGDIEDTLWTDFNGMGGGMSNKQTKNTVMTISPLKIKSDSLKLQLRRKDLHDVKRISTELLDNYTDSIRTIDAVQPLYYATLVTDDANNTSISFLKTKLENLISNNSENEALVLRCNYFIQKCKVKLGDYSSALTGFYSIMQSYPYNWEGIVASWDYAATHLVNQGGSGGGETLNLIAYRAEPSDIPNGDDPKNTKKTIEKTLTDTKEKTEKQFKSEEQKVKELQSDVKNEKNIKQSKSLEKKLQQKKIMQEVIKPRKPETVIEHIKFVNSDIQKIYSINDKTTGVEDNNSIPESYKLEQNYPNPFNPVTKIKFELPKESKVTIVIYDILGRKVAQLVNNELRQAGRYEVQFNGQNFASGVYFYRLVANDFVDTKRMVLVK